MENVISIVGALILTNGSGSTHSGAQIVSPIVMSPMPDRQMMLPAIGRIERGTLKQNQEIMVCNYHNPDAAPKKAKAVSLYGWSGTARAGARPGTHSPRGAWSR